jgi:hypothetical protein
MHRTVGSRSTSAPRSGRVERLRQRGRARRERTTFSSSVARQSCDDELTIIADRLADPTA